MEKFVLSKRMFAANSLFVISGTAMTVFFSNGPIRLRLLGILGSFAVLCVLVFKYNLPRLLFPRPIGGKYTIPAALAALAALHSNMQGFSGKGSSLIEKVNARFEIPETCRAAVAALYDTGLYAAAFFALCGCFYWVFRTFVPRAVRFFRSMERAEKWFLLCAGAVCITAVTLIFGTSDVYYAPADFPDGPVLWDVIYTSDSAGLLAMNAYLNPAAAENDIRQPLFGVFAMPFAAFAALVSKLLFFIPYAYPLAIAAVQIVLLHISMALLARMLGLKKTGKMFFLTGAVFSYPFLLFSLVIEQYIFALFYLMALVYVFIHKKQNRDFYFIAAAGSLATSAVLFPFLSYSKQFKVWFRDIFNCFLKFLAVLIVFGRFTEISNYSRARNLARFSGVGLAFKERLLQYVHFISLCFFAPAGTEIHTEPHISYQLAPVTGLHIPGLVLLAAALAGFVLNRRNTLARICAGWVLFSFVILCVIGWGTAENGLVLYTLYFSWAFLSLVVMAIEKLFAGLPLLKLFLYIIGIVGLAAVNIPGIAKIIDFGIRYYG